MVLLYMMSCLVVAGPTIRMKGGALKAHAFKTPMRVRFQTRPDALFILVVLSGAFQFRLDFLD
jgi:hypothetical protein